MNEQEQEQRQSVSIEQQQQLGRRYKFMSNALQGPAQQTEHVEFLSKFTPDTQISYQRLFSAMLAAGVVLLLYVLAVAGKAASYVFIPATLMMLGVMILILVFVLPARGRSMLEVAGAMLIQSVSSKFTGKAGRSGNLKSLGIAQFDDGLGTLLDGSLAIFYDVEGALSLSTLPGLADAIASQTSQYMIARPATSQQQSIISITRVEIEQFLRNMQIHIDNANTNSPRDAWSRHMNAKQQQYVTEAISGEYRVRQTIILSDIDALSLRKTSEHFDQAVRMGMFASAQRLMTEEELIHSLSPLTALSRKERAKHAKVKER